MKEGKELIYLDYCATTPISERSLEVYVKASTLYYGNTKSLHDEGEKANSLLENSRDAIARFINGEKYGIYFTSGGSESNYLAIRSMVNGKKGHLITTSIEHPSVINTFKQLQSEGYDVTFLHVNKYGEVAVETLKKALRENTILVSIGHGNSEIGTVQSLKELGYLLRQRGIPFHSDCVQTYGKIKIDVKDLYLDSISISSHKVYGPKGVGACYISPDIHWNPQLPNTSHESGFRQGTVNVPGIAAFTEATIEAEESLQKEQIRLKSLSTLLINHLKNKINNIHLVGHASNRLANHLSLRVPGIEGQFILLELNKADIAISTSTACKAQEQFGSQTMLQLGYTKDESREVFRISLGKFTTENHIIQTAEVLENIVNNFKKVGGNHL